VEHELPSLANCLLDGEPVRLRTRLAKIPSICTYDSNEGCMMMVACVFCQAVTVKYVQVASPVGEV
jgi:hypothetical protein